MSGLVHVLVNEIRLGKVTRKRGNLPRPGDPTVPINRPTTPAAARASGGHISARKPQRGRSAVISQTRERAVTEIGSKHGAGVAGVESRIPGKPAQRNPPAPPFRSAIPIINLLSTCPGIHSTSTEVLVAPAGVWKTQPRPLCRTFAQTGKKLGGCYPGNRSESFFLRPVSRKYEYRSPGLVAHPRPTTAPPAGRATVRLDRPRGTESAPHPRPAPVRLLGTGVCSPSSPTGLDFTSRVCGFFQPAYYALYRPCTEPVHSRDFIIRVSLANSFEYNSMVGRDPAQ